MRWPGCSNASRIARVAHDAARRGDVALLHREHDVVLERLRAALDQQVVGGQAGAADPEPGAADDVLDLVGDAVLALDLGDRLQVRLVGLAHLALLVLVEPAHARALGEVALVALDRGHRLEHPDPASPAAPRAARRAARRPCSRA